ncbi:L,D-transpeptidase family protein [Actinomadura sp. DC4]|uniref:L,D-transpeptidase n=1 Tax=Actinomadura sp. DC4 TaxID=3055069 RepID=UPI0025B248F7|nr:L,D-transpeptidase family protein [Actinomadura sp. DC4]MDN3354035.1 L,D-transpeptidase family protein [Actinomadura sp. DC4]
MSISFAVPGSRAAVVLAGALLSLTVAGCGGSGEHTASSAPPSGPTAHAPAATPVDFGNGPSTIATARTATVDIFKDPGDSAPSIQLHSPNPDGAPRVFLVTDRKPGWLHVLLPVQPNGSTGWIAAKQVRTAKTTYWIQVLRSGHRLKLYQGKKVLVSTPAAIGSTDTPTPGGAYYLTELLQPPNPKGDYGPYAYGLSGQSTALTQFNGRDPVIGIHGTNEPKLLGTSVSHGCIRVSNTVITRLARMLPLGTPVQIAV